MLRLARNKYPKGIFVRGDAANPAFLDGEFDVIVSRGCLASLMPFDDAVSMLTGAYRAMRPGGKFLFDFVANRERWDEYAPEGLKARIAWTRAEMEALIHDRLPSAAILAYDGNPQHSVNRILIQKPA